jgi:hypothetical protein
VTDVTVESEKQKGGKQKAEGRKRDRVTIVTEFHCHDGHDSHTCHPKKTDGKGDIKHHTLKQKTRKQWEER